ncbi:unnamed protein product [Paramecium sonneborni]|uniref:Checkpoint with forkhead and RING finger domains protein n=1 Tax=Paramecium sonneborni TaxID=65129 RepID=A0A8S1NAE2_9CILI|nr:unnamed protein product [Paramecium sonneborni]
MQGTPDLDQAPSISSIGKPWGKLVSMNGAKISSQDLFDNEVTIGRLPTNKIIIPDNRLSGTHCKLKWDSINNITQLQDLSTNGTFIGDQKIGKNNEILVKNGDEIYILHKSKVPISDIIGFTLIIQQVKEVQVAAQLDEQQQKKLQMMEDMQEDIHCPICDDLIFQCVSLMPCLHNFCGACFSDWMAKQKTCPSCRKDVQQVNKNPMVNNVVEKFLLMNPEKKRPPEEYKEMDEKNKIKGDALVFTQAPPPPLVPPPSVPIIQNVAPSRRGRGRAAIQQQQIQQSPSIQNNIQNQSNYDGPVTKDCITCLRTINGFQCQKRGQHINCTNCQSKMPKFDLNEKRLIFKCELCERSFCSIYNKNCAQISNKNPMHKLQDHQVPGTIDIQCFRQNYIEQKGFLDYQKNNNISTQHIFKYMLENYITKGLFRYIESNRILTNPVRNIDLTITHETPVCSYCFGQIWQQIVFRYRIAIKNELPDDLKNRSQCWYGINCKTMIHNQGHAKNYDHICEQTKL